MRPALVKQARETGNKSEGLVSELGINIPYLFNQETSPEWYMASLDWHSVIFDVHHYNSMSLTN